MLFIKNIPSIEKSQFLNYIQENVSKIINTKISKFTILISFMTSLIFTYFLFGLNIITNMFGFIYPCYMSILCLRDNKYSHKWLIYWNIYSFINLLESLFYFILFLPLYDVSKLLFLLWLIDNNIDGTGVIYDLYFKNDSVSDTKIDKEVSKLDNKTQNMDILDSEQEKELYEENILINEKVKDKYL